MAMSHRIEPESPSSLPPLVRIGEVIAGKYRLDRILGAGGMGVVLGATHLQLDQRIAIKFMSPFLLYNEDGLQRFMQEARLAARIQCEHVVRVFDVASLEDGTPYIVMEYLEGQDLRVLLQDRGRLPSASAVDYVLQAGEAIAEAHVASIVHRDLKPGNLFCCKRVDGSRLVKVLDFGVSKLLPKADATQRGLATGPHVIMGSPAYASPEQLREPARVDARTDIWSLGAILYELVSGKPPFAADTFLELCTRVVKEPPTPLRMVCPDVAPELAAVVERSLAKSPEGRFQTVAEFARALAPCARSRSLLSIERIENVIRCSKSRTSVRSASPSLRSGAQDHGDRTLPSQPERSSGLRTWYRRPLLAIPRWILLAVAVSTASAVLGAATALLATHRASPPSARAPTSTVTPTPTPTPSLAPTLAPTPTLTLAPTPEPTVLAPLADPPPAPPAPSVRTDTVGAKKPGPPARRAPETSQFGGLL
jgi:serine/threonine-protein kinase